MLPIKFFVPQSILSKKFQDLFDQIAKTITKEYILDNQSYMEEYSAPISFGETIKKVKSLNHELNLHAEKIKNDYRENKGVRSMKLTISCKRTVRRSLDEYLHYSLVAKNKTLCQL